MLLFKRSRIVRYINGGREFNSSKFKKFRILVWNIEIPIKKASPKPNNKIKV
jgi:hypothetical protein